MGFFGTLLGAYGAYNAQKNANKKESAQEGFEQQRIDAERQRTLAEQQQAEADRAYRNSQLDLSRQDIEQRKQSDIISNRERGYGPDGQPLPFKAPTLPPLGKGGKPDSAYLARQARAYQQAAIDQGNYFLAKVYGDRAAGLEQDAQRESATALAYAHQDETLHGKLPLEQAQAGWWKGKHQEVEDGYKAAYARADLAAQARMNSAAQSARARMTGAGNDERETIALMAALNAQGGRDNNQAFQQAKAQYENEYKTWSRQQQNYDLGVTQTPPGPAPVFNISAGGGGIPPIVINVPVTMPNGTVRNVPIVRPGSSAGGGAGAPAGGDRVSSARSIVARLRANGTPDAQIRQMMAQSSQHYTPAEINAVVGGGSAPAPAPGRPAIQGISPLLLPGR